MTQRYCAVMLLVLCLGMSGQVMALSPRILAWSDLQPAGEAEHNARLLGDIQIRLYEGIRKGELTVARAQVDVLKRQIRAEFVLALDKQYIRLPGYMVPLDMSAPGQTSEFLLVPFYGACLHVPAPPPNQIVHVVSERSQPVGALSVPLWIEGMLTLDQGQAGEPTYRLELRKLTPYEEERVPYRGPRPHPAGQ